MPGKPKPVPALKETLGASAPDATAVPSQEGDKLPLANIDTLQVPDMKFGCSFLLLGSTRSGKSTLVNYLFHKYFTKHITCLMSNSLQSDAYTSIKKKCITSDIYHPEVLHEMYHINHETNNHYPFMVILDDLTHVRHDKQYQRLLTIYRNSRMSAIVSAQGLTMFDSIARTNINFVMLGRLNNDLAIEKVIKEYLISHFPRNINMSDKIKMYRNLTENHYWIVIDNINGIVFRTKLTPQQVF